MGYVGNEPSVNFTSFAKQDLTGVTGSPAKRGYTLSHAVANANEIEVFVNNVRQEPTEAYTVSGNGLTMTGDVETSDDFYIIFLGKAIQTTVPPDGSVTSAKLDTNIAVGGTLTVSGAFTSQGIDDNADATAITIDSSEIATFSNNIVVSDRVVGANDLVLVTTDSNEKIHMDSDGYMKFETAGSERMRIHSTGRMSINGTSSGSSHVTIYFASASYSALASQMTDNGSGAGFLVCRKSDGSTIGQVARNGTSDAVQFLTSSDYRLKENINYDFDATSKLKQLKPCKFTWKNDDSNVVFDGFLAHELQEIVSHAVNGKKDAVNEDGKIEAQSIDKSDLVPLLVKTIQELEARITALENK
jgi:sRNA-binding regulator protein Hfq